MSSYDGANAQQDYEKMQQNSKLDLLPLMKRVSKDMDVGGLMMAASFNAQSAMLATELGIAKMDPNMPHRRHLHPSLGLKAMHCPTKPTIKAVMGFCHQWVRREVAWLEGATLQQSLLTCLLYHYPVHLECPVAVAIVQSLAWSSQDILRVIVRAGVHQRDEFITESEMYLAPTGMATSHQDALQQLGILDRCLSALIQGKKEEARGHSALMAERLLQDDVQKDDLLQLAAHVKSRRAVVSAIGHCLRGWSSLKGASAACRTGISHFSTILETVTSGKENASEGEGKKQSEEYEILSNVWVEGLCDCIVQGVPPVAPTLPSVQEAYTYLSQWMSDVQMLHRPSKCETPSDWEEFVENWSDVLPARCLLSRACVACILPLRDADQWRGSVRQGMSSVGVQDVDDRGKKRAVVAAAVERQHSDLFALCQNRGKQRRVIAKSLRNWGLLMSSCEQVDKLHDLSQGGWAGWATDRSYAKAARYLLLGVPLGLYSQEEMVSVYWYADYCLTVELSCRSQSSDNGLLSQREIDRTCFVQSQACICRGMFKLHAALRKVQRHACPDVHQALYTRRMSPLWDLPIPGALLHENYVQSTDTTEYSTETLLESAESSFRSCQDFLSACGDGGGDPLWLERCKQLKKTCLTLCATTALLKRNADVDLKWENAPFIMFQVPKIIRKS